MSDTSRHNQLFESLVEKAELKQTVYQHTFESFKMLKPVIDNFTEEYRLFNKEKKTEKSDK